MKGSKFNIKFNYLYRDAGNYKIFGCVIFSNQKKIDLERIELEIKDNLIDKEFFYPLDCKIPVLNFDGINEEISDVWYEFENVEFTDEHVTDNKSIEEFLLGLQLQTKTISRPHFDFKQIR